MPRREPVAIPFDLRDVVMALTKADLAELLWEFADQATGGYCTAQEVLGAIAREHADRAARSLQRHRPELDPYLECIHSPLTTHH